MTDYRCPDCGAPISAGAVVCSQCGFPIQKNGPAARGGSGPGTAGIVIGVVVGGFVVVMMIGMLAALAIPQFTKATARAKEKEGEALLKWAYTAERAYLAEHGMYTSDASALTGPARPAATGPRRYTLEISAASDRDLCLEAVPRPGMDVSALSMDATGSIYHSAGCSGEPAYTMPTGPSGQDGARQMLREVHEGIVAYHAEHGEYPRKVPDVVTRVHDTPAASEFLVLLPRADGASICATAFPRDVGAGLSPMSVDQDGNLYNDAQCRGPVMERFTITDADDAPTGDEKPAQKP
ncbi:MAG TPA: zinc-ribbon domain-containing protein [Longimicrobium sp.]|nr:zinc-ribbon domain-containing protein [Longimicrobium sp.]